MSPVPYPLINVDRMQAASSLLQLGTYNFSALSPITIETSEPDFSKAIASVLWTRHRGQPSCTVFKCGVDNCPLCPGPAGKPATTVTATPMMKQASSARETSTGTTNAAFSRRSSVVNWLVSPSSSSSASRKMSPSYGKRPYPNQAFFTDPISTSISCSSHISVGCDEHPAKRQRAESGCSDDDRSIFSISPPASSLGDRPFACQSCPKSFSQRTSLRTHLRTHTGARPYRCVDCDQRFGDLSTLTKHRRTHTGEKPYRCLHEGCGRAFAQSGNLKRHYRTHALDKKLQQICA